MTPSLKFFGGRAGNADVFSVGITLAERVTFSLTTPLPTLRRPQQMFELWNTDANGTDTQVVETHIASVLLVELVEPEIFEFAVHLLWLRLSVAWKK